MRIGVVSPYARTVPGGVNNYVLHPGPALGRTGSRGMGDRAGAGDLAHSVVEVPTRLLSSGRAFPVRANGSVAYVGMWP